MALCIDFCSKWSFIPLAFFTLSLPIDNSGSYGFKLRQKYKKKTKIKTSKYH